MTTLTQEQINALQEKLNAGQVAEFIIRLRGMVIPMEG